MSTRPQRKLRPSQTHGLDEMLPVLSGSWIRRLPRGRMRWPMVLERASKYPTPLVEWRMVEDPAFVACLADSTLFVMEERDGSGWTLYDAANMGLASECYGLHFEEARAIAVLVQQGIVDYWSAFSRVSYDTF